MRKDIAIGIIIGNLLASLVVFGGMLLWSHFHPVKHKEPLGEVSGSPYVQSWFDGINETQFDGKLPPTIVVYEEAPDHVVGQTVCEIDPGISKPIACKIYITPRYNVAQVVAAETVIHEACHTATYFEFEDHGPKWQGCMLRIAENGGFKWVW